MAAIRAIKWGGSDGGQCPHVLAAEDLAGIEAVERSEPGGVLIVGSVLPEALQASLAEVADIAEHEQAVWVPTSLLRDDLPKLLSDLGDNDG